MCYTRVFEANSGVTLSKQSNFRPIYFLIAFCWIIKEHDNLHVNVGVQHIAQWDFHGERHCGGWCSWHGEILDLDMSYL